MHEIFKVKPDCFASLPSCVGPYVFVGDVWIRSIDVPVKHLASKKKAILLACLAFVHESGYVSWAPVYLKFDGGSKPKASWLFLGHPFGEYLFSYGIHDYEWGLIWSFFRAGKITARERRKQLKASDRRFREIHLYIGRHFLNKGIIESVKNRIKYRGVRVFAGVKGVFVRGK